MRDVAARENKVRDRHVTDEKWEVERDMTKQEK
jgi:hypothetical protein